MAARTFLSTGGKNSLGRSFFVVHFPCKPNGTSPEERGTVLGFAGEFAALGTVTVKHQHWKRIRLHLDLSARASPLVNDGRRHGEMESNEEQ